MNCPRCAGALKEGLEGEAAGAYRSTTTERICGRCEVVVADGAELAERAGTTKVDLRRSPLCRLREPIDAPCRNCGADVRDALHLSWEGGRDVIVEVCDCGAHVVARNDAARLQQMLRAAEPMHRIG
jgi:hypothetical protein